MTIRFLQAFTVFAVLGLSESVTAQIDVTTTRDRPEVSRAEMDAFIERARLELAAADLLRAMHEAYELEYDAAWQAFHAKFEPDQQAAFAAANRDDQSEFARLGDSLREYAATWRHSRTQLLLTFLDDAAVGLPEAHAPAWEDFSRKVRRARIMEELDPYALDPEIFDLADHLSALELTEDERREVDELLAQYGNDMDAVIGPIQAQFDDWFEKSQQPNLDEASRAGLGAEFANWHAQVRAVNAQFLALANAAITEHRAEFEAMESARKNPALYVTSPVDRVMTILRDEGGVALDRLQVFDEEYDAYLGRRASLRRQFLQAHARWLPGTEERWARRDDAIRRREQGELIDANAELHGHPGMPAMAELFALEERTLAAIRRELSEEEFARLLLEGRILLDWPESER